MATLEKVMQMKQEGLTEPQIIDSLRQQGISPREIQESLSQSKIKNSINAKQPKHENIELQQSMMPTGVDAPQNANQSSQMPTQFGTQQNSMQSSAPLPYQEQSLYQDSQMPTQNNIQQPPQEQQMNSQMPSPEQSFPSQEQSIPTHYPEEQTGGYQDYNPEYTEYQPQQAVDVETITDISEQIIEEKTAGIKKQVTSFKKFQDTLSLEIERINSRLMKMENNFNELQMAIIKRVGGYGESIDSIEKEMKATQNSFAKIVDPLVANIQKLKKISSEGLEEEPTKKSKRRRPKKEDFKNYLR